MKTFLTQKILLIVSLLILFLPSSNILAQEDAEVLDNTINIYFFWGEGCPHCEKEEVFLNKIEEKYDDVRVYDYEVWGSRENLNLMKEFGRRLNADVRGVPFTVIGENYIIGWLNDEYTGKQVEDAIDCARNNRCTDLGVEILNPVQEKEEREEQVIGIPDRMKLPLIGEIETKNFSLPLLTVVLGSIDGFNPCAMWTLVFLISLLLGLKDRKRMWILGIVFIATSAFVYFLFMAAWLNFILFIGMVTWVRVVIGLIALFGGGYNLKEYITNKDAECKVTKPKKRKQVFHKLRDIVRKESFPLAIGGIILLAFAVNLVEAVCSAGLPTVYTQILSLNNLSTLQYYLYILLYIFFFMLDDLIVFGIAMKTLQMTKVTSRYTRMSHLVGGILMLALGLLLIFKPELLMFG